MQIGRLINDLFKFLGHGTDASDQALFMWHALIYLMQVTKVTSLTGVALSLHTTSEPKSTKLSEIDD